MNLGFSGSQVASAGPVEKCVFVPARAVLDRGELGRKGGLVLDCCKQHGIHLKWTEREDGTRAFGFTADPWLQQLCEKYNFVLLPVPHNTR